MNPTATTAKLNETIRIRVGKDLKSRAERLVGKLNAKLPVGAREYTVADVTRMALAQFTGVEKAK